MKNILLLMFLVGLTIIAYIVMVYVKGKRVTHFGNINTLRKVHGFKRFHISPIILFFKVFVIILLFLVATGAIEVLEQKSIPNADYVILIDSSSSMSNTDYKPNRLEVAKTIASDWLGTIPNSTRVGLIAFAQDINFVLAPTEKSRLLRNTIDQIEINYSQSGTSLDYALNYAFDLLKNDSTQGRKRSILLLTDGTQDVSPDTLAFANSNRVNIYSFGIGSNEPEDENDRFDIPEEFQEYYSAVEFNFTKLEELSEKTNGKAFEITTTQELKKAFDEATFENISLQLNSSYYITILIALMSIIELLIYSRYGGL